MAVVARSTSWIAEWVGRLRASIAEWTNAAPRI